MILSEDGAIVGEGEILGRGVLHPGLQEILEGSADRGTYLRWALCGHGGG